MVHAPGKGLEIDTHKYRQTHRRDALMADVEEPYVKQGRDGTRAESSQKRQAEEQ